MLFKKLLFFVLIGISTEVSAQSVTLDSCKQWAHDNYPAIKQYRLIEAGRDYTVDNARKNWLPQVSATASGIAMTDILSLPSQLKAVGMDANLKNATAAGVVNVQQRVYDGGSTKAQQCLTQAQADVQARQLDVTMYDINQRVEQLYFGVLTMEEQLRQNSLLQQDLSISEKTVRSMLRTGTANPTDLDAVLVEEVKARQQQEAMNSSRTAYLNMLSTFVGRTLNSSTTFVRPASLTTETWNEQNVQRPELSLYEARRNVLDAQRKQLDARLKPQVSAFGMGMYHTRMSDLIHNGMLLGGLTVSWNIGALYTRKNDLAQLDNQRQQIEAERATFLYNLHLQDQQADGSVSSLRKQITQDDEIVRLRENIRSKSEKKVQLGTESINEMLRDVNAVSTARQQKALHELQLLQVIYEKENNLGK